MAVGEDLRGVLDLLVEACVWELLLLREEEVLARILEV
jgi:hypothetical protein